MQPLKKTKLVILQGEMVEWSITTVLKTVVPRGTGGSNPSLSAKSCKSKDLQDFLFCTLGMTLSNGCKSIVSRKSWNYIAKSKGVHREVKSEGCCR